MLLCPIPSCVLLCIEGSCSVTVVPAFHFPTPSPGRCLTGGGEGGTPLPPAKMQHIHKERQQCTVQSSGLPGLTVSRSLS